MQVKCPTTLILPGLELPAGTHTVPESYRALVENFAATSPTLAQVLDAAPAPDPAAPLISDAEKSAIAEAVKEAVSEATHPTAPKE
jgi:hypothetical protein